MDLSDAVLKLVKDHMYALAHEASVSTDYSTFMDAADALADAIDLIGERQ